MPLTGCIDKDYDLSDIDTNVRVEVDDLVVPVNLDAITLSNIFDIDNDDENSVIKEIGDSYAVLVNGNFMSSDIRIADVTLSNTGVNPIVVTTSTSGIEVPPGANSVFVSLPFGNALTDFSFVNSSIDSSIRAFDRVGTNWTIRLTLDFGDFASMLSTVTIKDLVLRLPDGLVTPDYTNNNGLVQVGDRQTDASGKLVLDIPVTAIDVASLPENEFKFTPDAAGVNPGTVSYAGKLGVESGIVTGTLQSGTPVPSTVTMVVTPFLGNIEVRTFSGILAYTLDSFNVDNVTLNDLPDVLTQEDTDIRIANPQLYLSVNNPVAPYKGVAHSGLSLTPLRDGVASAPCVLPSSSLIEIGYDKGAVGPYVYCLSPSRPDSYYEGYAGATHLQYPALADVLSGKGLPTEIAVSFDNAGIGGADNHVVDFPVGKRLDDVEGAYTFYAPLAFDAGSQVVYAETEDGWNDDTLDKLTIRKVGLKATVDNTLPFDIVLSGYPVNVDGNQCKDASGRLAELSSVRVKAGETSEINLESNGVEIQGLDGIRYEARAEVTKGNELLRPSATITLSGIRVTVSGYYEDEL